MWLRENVVYVCLSTCGCKSVWEMCVSLWCACKWQCVWSQKFVHVTVSVHACLSAWLWACVRGVYKCVHVYRSVCCMPPPRALGPVSAWWGRGRPSGKVVRNTECGKSFFESWKSQSQPRIHFSNKRSGITWQIIVSDQINYSFHFTILFGGEL